jgi:hypothetical protein
MQERDTSGNITPPNVNESEAQDTTTGNQMGENSHANIATYRQQKNRSTIMYCEPLLEIIKEKN